jgi:fructose-bisphosphate aldolase class II
LEFGCEGQAGKIKGETLQAIALQYAQGQLAPQVH